MCEEYLIIIDDNCQLNSSWAETVCWFWEVWQLLTRSSSKNNSSACVCAWCVCVSVCGNKTSVHVAT